MIVARHVNDDISGITGKVVQAASRLEDGHVAEGPKPLDHSRLQRPSRTGNHDRELARCHWHHVAGGIDQCCHEPDASATAAPTWSVSISAI